MRREMQLLVLLALFGVLSVSGQATVVTDKGSVRGVQVDDAIQWLGIPYAKAPVDNLRFALPAAADAWSGVRSASQAGSICPQMDTTTGTMLGAEDCLFANVFAPKGSSKRLPVMVWIHGGGWTAGDGLQGGMFNGTALASKRNVIVVTFNYRLGALGFLNVDSGVSTAAAGNYGIHDQIALLKWVKRNIRAFGGDPSSVTLFGESAGAFSTCIHMASPLSRGLFHNAILQSGTCSSKVFYTSRAASRAWSMAAIGSDAPTNAADRLAYLRGLSLASVMAIGTTPTPSYRPIMHPIMSWGATIDNVLLDETPIRMFEDGRANPVKSVILGSNLDEGTQFVMVLAFGVVPGLVPFQPLVAGDMERVVAHYFGQNDTVLTMVNDAYPVSDYASVTEQTQVVLRDFFFRCPTSRAALALGSSTKSYVYQYTHSSVNDPQRATGVYHQAELPAVWNTPVAYNFTSDDKVVANTFGTYWSSLATHSNPNTLSNGKNRLPNWPTYKRKALRSMQLDIQSVVVNKLEEDNCRVWDEIAQWAPPVVVV